MISRSARILYVLGACLFLAGVLAAVFLAGMGFFARHAYFRTHTELAYTLGLLPLVLIVLSFAARLPRGTKGLTALLFVLYMVQIGLPSFRGSASAVAALHPVGALFLGWVAFLLARRGLSIAWRRTT